MSGYILSLDSKRALQEVHAGGKGASLAWLRRNGFHVPPGFVVTSTAFHRFLASLGIEPLIHSTAWTQDNPERIQALLVAGRIPDRLARAICSAYRDLGGRVAVRSSMVGEDTHVASFAGQLDTFLNVEEESALLEAVKRCWASMFNGRLFSYLAGREMASPQPILDSLSMAVVVQRMVDARAAGVAFSADPVTGQPCVVIEATRGLGDALVRGLAEPDRYVVDARGVIEVRPTRTQVPVLADEQVLHLAELVRHVAGRIKAPQDIEWAWDGTAFHLLQSRPVTSLVGRTVYSCRLVSDMSPGLVKPLLYSTNTVAMTRNVFGRVFNELLGPCDVDYSLLVRRIHSRIYANMTLFGELLERTGLPPNFLEMMARDERATRRRPRFTPRSLYAMAGLLRFSWRHARVADDISAFIQRHDRELEPYRQAEWSSNAPQDLLEHVDRLTRLHGESQWFVFIGPVNMMIRNRLLGRLVKRWAPDVLPGDLIRGLVGLKALEPNQELQRLGAQARALGDQVQRLLVEQDNATICAALSTSEQGRALMCNMDAFLRRYGFLSTNATDFSGTPWIENPALIWHAIGRAAANPLAPVESQNVETIREQSRGRVRARLNWALRSFFDRLLASTITYIDLRERTSLLFSEDSYQMRRLFLALAGHFTALGHLERPDDIFYLACDEVRQLVEGKLEPSAVRQLVAARRAEMETDAHTELPDTICGEHAPTRPILPVEGQDYLVGISGSSGLAQGYARVVLDPAAAPVTLGRDDILVVPFTDVGWTPLFSGIGGIVAETGGQLSHTSIVAREYGLPAVVSVKKATHLIRDRQPLTLDGDAGRVYLKHVLELGGR